MRHTVFIPTNGKQLIGARLGKFSIERKLPPGSDLSVEIINVDTLPEFQEFAGAAFRRGSETWVHDPDDLQSFTLARLMPPKLMGYAGKAVVIDPDVFALADISPLFEFDMHGRAIACPQKKTGAWESSVMLLDCGKLRHWDIKEILEGLRKGKYSYHDFMRLERETSVTQLPWEWDSFDHIDSDTKMLHTTRRLTQPWRTGLPIDFKRARMPKILGVIPREPVHRLLGKTQKYYLPHPDKTVEKFFFELLADAIRTHTISKADVMEEVERGHVRKDVFSVLGTYGFST